jgi:hypothetical protein
MEQKRVEVKVLKDGQLRRADALVGKLAGLFTKAAELQKKMDEAADGIAAAIAATRPPQNVPDTTAEFYSTRNRRLLRGPEAWTNTRGEPPVVSAPPARPPASPTPHAAAAPKARPPAPADGEGESRETPTSREQLTKPQRKILDAYAWWHSVGVAKPPRENIAPLAEYGHVRSRGFTDPLYSLQSMGLVADNALTDAGTALAAWPETVDTLGAYHEKLKKVLRGPERKLFDAVHARGGRASREELASDSGYAHVRSRGFTDPLYTLHRMGLVELEKGDVVATPLMYPETLTARGAA